MNRRSFLASAFATLAASSAVGADWFIGRDPPKPNPKTAPRPPKILTKPEGGIMRRRVPSRLGPEWTWPGAILTHLLNTHGLTQLDVAGRSHRELVLLHNDCHNGNVRWQPIPAAKPDKAAACCPDGT